MDKSFTYFCFIFSTFLVALGILFEVNQLYVQGRNWYTKDYTAYGGVYMILFGILGYYLWYQTLSPFSRIKQFFEKFRKK